MNFNDVLRREATDQEDQEYDMLTDMFAEMRKEDDGLRYIVVYYEDDNQRTKYFDDYIDAFLEAETLRRSGMAHEISLRQRKKKGEEK